MPWRWRNRRNADLDKLGPAPAGDGRCPAMSGRRSMLDESPVKRSKPLVTLCAVMQPLSVGVRTTCVRPIRPRNRARIVSLSRRAHGLAQTWGIPRGPACAAGRKVAVCLTGSGRLGVASTTIGSGEAIRLRRTPGPWRIDQLTRRAESGQASHGLPVRAGGKRVHLRLPDARVATPARRS